MRCAIIYIFYYIDYYSDNNCTNNYNYCDNTFPKINILMRIIFITYYYSITYMAVRYT